MTPAPDELVLPECGPTTERLQTVLDGGPWASLDADPHAVGCATCRERVCAARLLLTMLGSRPVVSTPNFAGRVLAELKPEPRRRGRTYAVAGGIAIAAAVLLAVWAFNKPEAKSDVPSPPEMVDKLPDPVPAAEPIRLNEKLAKTGQALLDTARPLTEAPAPKLFASLPNPFARAVPAVNFEPAGRALADLPDAARAGFEPISDSASKAFARMMRDVSAVKPKM